MTCDLIFVDLESEDLGGGGVRHYIELASILSENARICIIAKSNFIKNVLVNQYPNLSFIKYEPGPVFNPKAFFDGYKYGKKLRPKAVISTTLYFNTYAFSQGISISAKSPLIILMYHHPRFFMRIKKMGIKGLATYIFYSPAFLSRYFFRNNYLFYTYGLNFKGKNIYNNIRISIDKTVCNHDNTNYKEFDLCFLGRLSKMKGFDEFTNTAEIIKNKIPSLKVAVIGKKFNIDFPSWFNYFGFANEEEKLRILSRCKVFFLPSHEEGFSIATLEAMCNGAVPVVWDLREYPFKNIIKIKEGDINKAANAIIDLLNDDKTRNIIASKAKEEALIYTSNNRINDEINTILKISKLDTT